MNLRALQRGVTVFELLLAISILGLVVAGAATLVDNHMERLRIAATAQQMTVFGNAVQAYIKDNYAPMTVANTNGVPTATKTIPAVITTKILQTTPLITPSGSPPSATKYLPANFNPVNNYGQTLCALVLQPNSGELYALVVAENRGATTTPINDFDLGLLAGLMGGAGGGIYSTATGIAQGTTGKWRIDLINDLVGKFFNNTSATHCDNTAGAISLPVTAATGGRPLMALWFSSDTSSAFLYRNAVPNHPELNTMNNDLKFLDDHSCIDPLTGNTITCFGASLSLQITRTGETLCDAVPTANGKPVPLGTLARDTSGKVLSCQQDPTDSKNYWRSVSSLFWGDPVENWAALTALTCDATHNAWQTRVVKFPTAGSGPRAYTCGLTASGGSTWRWQPIAVDDKGALQLGTTQFKENSNCNDAANGLSIGSVTKDSQGQLLVCTSVTTASGTSIVWKGSAAIGHFRFRISGYTDPFVGTGHLNVSVPAQPTFSGTLTCDPNQAKYGHAYNPACGSGGSVSCSPMPNPLPSVAQLAGVNSQPSCAYFFALHSQSGWGCLLGIPGLLCIKDPWHYLDAPLLVQVVDLPVTNVVRAW